MSAGTSAAPLVLACRLEARHVGDIIREINQVPIRPMADFERLVGEPWHALDLAAVAAHLRADLDAGLTAGEARERLARVGPNRVGDHPETPLWRLALAQFRSLVVLLLLAGALVAWVLGERAEALAILAALVLNAAIGFASEWRARISMARLRALAVPRALVRRGGLVVQIPSTELVPGDLIVLEAGVRVPWSGAPRSA